MSFLWFSLVVGFGVAGVLVCFSWLGDYIQGKPLYFWAGDFVKLEVTPLVDFEFDELVSLERRLHY